MKSADLIENIGKLCKNKKDKITPKTVNTRKHCCEYKKRKKYRKIETVLPRQQKDYQN